MRFRIWPGISAKQAAENMKAVASAFAKIGSCVLHSGLEIKRAANAVSILSESRKKRQAATPSRRCRVAYEKRDLTRWRYYHEERYTRYLSYLANYGKEGQE